MPAIRVRLPLLASVFLALAVMAARVDAQQPPSLQGKTAEQVFKNIQVLNGTPADQLNSAMHLMESQLGVECEFCHIENQWDKDDKKTKTTARQMMKMVFELNKNSFDARQEVTCYTCHRGSSRPLTVPEMPEPTAVHTSVTSSEQAAEPQLPSADQILSNYVQALGGESAIRKVTSRVIKGTRDLPTGPGGRDSLPSQAESYQAAPNLRVNIYTTAKGTLSDGFDGETAWAQDLRGIVADAPAIDQLRAKRGSDLYESIDLKNEYSKIEVMGTAKIDGKDAYILTGTPPNDLPERLYFDVKTGLLLRKLTFLPTALGRSPYQVDYEDYRDTGSGVKIPFVVYMTPATPRSALCFSCNLDFSRSVFRVQSVQDNVKIDPKKFAKPASEPAPKKG